MVNKASTVVVGTILLTLFLSTSAFGLIFVYEYEWCQSGELCAEAWKMLRAAMECALVASVAAAICVWVVRLRLARMRTSALIAIGLTSAALLFGTFHIALEIRSTLASHFFPYVTSIRFGFLGISIVWGTFSVSVCAAVIAVVLRIDNLTSRLRADAP